MTADEEGPEEHREYRNCPCGSTLIVHVKPAHRGACALEENAPGNENLDYLLMREVRAIGHERETATRHANIRLFIGDYGSYRYVGFDKLGPTSAIQLMSRDGRHARVANVFTRPDVRRRGWATRLFQAARRRFQTIEHSDDLSGAGRAWAERVERESSRRPV